MAEQSLTPQIKPKHAGGRPTKYKPEFCQKIIEYFDIPPYQEIVKKRYTRKDGEVIEEFGLRANDLRFFEVFAKEICDVDDSTLVDWTKRYPEFNAAYLYAKKLQLLHLANNALHETFNSYFAVFTAKNISGWRDKVDVEHSGEMTLLEKYKDQSIEQLKERAQGILRGSAN